VRISTILLLGLSPWNTAVSQDSEAVFVPHTLLTQHELDEQKTKLIEERGYDEETAEELVRRIPEIHLKFTEENIRSVFPAIDPGDKRQSLCRNSMMSDNTALVYLSPKPEQAVIVKHSTCYPTDGGLLCSPLSEYKSYYFEAPEIHFTLSADVTIDEANDILTIFRDSGIEGLPNWYKRQKFGYRDVTHIDKVGVWYVLHLGEFHCRGCTAKFKVIIEAPGDKPPALVLDAEPEGMCI
jgi:hypothetical protein